MSKTFYNNLHVQFVNSNSPIVIQVEDGEYKEMLNILRLYDHQQHAWVKDKKGIFYNMQYVKYFWVINMVEED